MDFQTFSGLFYDARTSRHRKLMIDEEDNWKEFGRKLSWTNHSTIPSFGWSGEENH